MRITINMWLRVYMVKANSSWRNCHIKVYMYMYLLRGKKNPGSCHIYLYIFKFHIWILGQREFCMICFNVVAKSSMVKHVKTHQNLEESQCPQCKEVFKNVYFTRRHQKQVHNKIIPKKKKKLRKGNIKNKTTTFEKRISTMDDTKGNFHSSHRE